MRKLLPLVLFFLSVIDARAQQPQLEGAVRPVEVIAKFDDTPGSSPFHWSHTVESPGSAFIRVHFSEIENENTDDFRVSIRDRAGRIAQEFTRETFNGDLWSFVISGDYASIEVSSKEKPSKLSFKLKEIAYQKSSFVPYSIVPPDEREAIVVYRDNLNIFQASRAVAKLSFLVEGGMAMCTGFLIDNDRMLTNWHCIANEDVCKTATAIFGYEIIQGGILSPGTQYRCGRVVFTSMPLDYTVLQLDGNPGSTWGFLKLSNREPTLGEQAYIIGHPAGEPKQISRKKCQVSTLFAAGADPADAKTDLGHKCDTLGGNSGSPVLGQDFQVIGLHHYGFGNDTRWSSENRAVRMRRILEQIESH